MAVSHLKLACRQGFNYRDELTAIIGAKNVRASGMLNARLIAQNRQLTPERGTTMSLELDADDRIPAIVQDLDSREVLMLGWMNRESLNHTYRTGHVTFWSRSRNELWEKGLTSGNYLDFVSLQKNCENNSLLVMARPQGPTCHTKNTTCYYREVDPSTDLP